MTPYQAYEKYLAMRTHFSSEKYNYFANNGKVRVTAASFDKRPDKWMFGRLAHLYTENDYLDLLLGNIVKNWPTNIYVHMLLHNDSKEVMFEYQKRIQSLSYTFANDLDILFASVKEPDDVFKIDKGKNPIILNMVYRGDIAKETFIILNNIFNFFPIFTKKLNDEFSWEPTQKFYLKYKPFINYDVERINSIIKEKVNVKRGIL